MTMVKSPMPGACAAAFHDEYIIGIWLEKRGCSLTSFDDLGNTPIHIAAALANKQRSVNIRSPFGVDPGPN